MNTTPWAVIVVYYNAFSAEFPSIFDNDNGHSTSPRDTMYLSFHALPIAIEYDSQTAP